MTKELPALFDTRGKFCEVADDVLATLSETQAALYLAIRDDVHDLANCEMSDESCKGEIADAAKAAADATSYMQTAFPSMSFLDEWRNAKRI